ncbi:MAG: 50S ribosomal protein L22, partial [Clostridiales bacterium]|nr:50S ribosomal protein L22 [Clostridiales bacterium]
SPRKARHVIDLIRGKDVNEALSILQFTPKRASNHIFKVLKSAASNAEHNYDMDKDSLVVTKAHVDQGPTIKRWTARGMGRADIIRSKTSHITVVVKEKKEG